jgi:hypothetical protein
MSDPNLDRVTEVSSQGLFARLGQSVIGSLIAAVSEFQLFAAQLNAASAADYKADAAGFYHGQNSANPAVGDLRVTFTAAPAETMSVVAAQASGMLAPFRAANGYRIALAQPGVLSLAEMFREKKAEEGRLTWILHAVGFVVMLIGFLLVMGPLPVLASVLPFLGGIAEAGIFIVALSLSLPLTLFTIAAAWIAHRPIIGALLLVAGAALFWLMHRLHRKAPAAAAQRS